MKRHTPSSPKRTVISATQLQREVGSVIRRVAVNGEHIVVERDGFPVVTIIPVALYEATIENHE